MKKLKISQTTYYTTIETPHGSIYILKSLRSSFIFQAQVLAGPISSSFGLKFRKTTLKSEISFWSCILEILLAFLLAFIQFVEVSDQYWIVRGHKFLSLVVCVKDI